MSSLTAFDLSGLLGRPWALGTVSAGLAKQQIIARHTIIRPVRKIAPIMVYLCSTEVVTDFALHLPPTSLLAHAMLQHAQVTEFRRISSLTDKSQLALLALSSSRTAVCLGSIPR